MLLDVTSIAPDRILLLDTFFHVIVYHGETVSAWRKQVSVKRGMHATYARRQMRLRLRPFAHPRSRALQGYHESPEHQNFRELLSAPKEDAAELLQQRFPVPMYIECDQYGSQVLPESRGRRGSTTHRARSRVARVISHGRAMLQRADCTSNCYPCLHTFALVTFAAGSFPPGQTQPVGHPQHVAVGHRLFRFPLHRRRLLPGAAQ